MDYAVYKLGGAKLIVSSASGDGPRQGRSVGGADRRGGRRDGPGRVGRSAGAGLQGRPEAAAGRAGRSVDADPAS